MMRRGRTGPGGTGRDGPGRDLTGRDGAGRDGASQTAGREVARPDRTARGVTVIVPTACLGTAMMVVHELSLPARSQALTAAGLLLVGRTGRRSETPVPARWPRRACSSSATCC